MVPRRAGASEKPRKSPQCRQTVLLQSRNVKGSHIILRVLFEGAGSAIRRRLKTEGERVVQRRRSVLNATDATLAAILAALLVALVAFSSRMADAAAALDPAAPSAAASTPSAPPA